MSEERSKLSILNEKYGQLMIQAEIINGQVQETKRAIAEELQRGQQAPVEVKPVS